ncbi:MAG: SPOR domain-containing protein, partial [Pseudomonadota bacterium]
AQVQTATPSVAVAETSPQPGFDLARVSGTSASNPAETTPAPRMGPAQAAVSSPPAAQQRNFSDAFGDLGTGDLPDAKASGDAVNIADIEVPREAQVASEPAEPKHPRRIWVQVATGRDRSALRFDWRRITRKASRLLRDYEPHVVAWGQSNRLLAGPVESTGEARKLVNALGERGIDTFSYTSPEGTEIQELE